MDLKPEKEKEIVNNYAEFAQASTGDPNESPYYLGRSLYKYTACGPWTVFILDEPLLKDKFNPDELYYEDKQAGDCDLANHIIGVKVGSIVEGSDVEIGPETLMFPFEMEKFWEAVEEVNDQASFYWERDNSSWFLLFHPDHSQYHVKACWGDWEWNFGDEKDQPPEEVKQAVIKWIDEENYCFQHYEEPEVIPNAPEGWTLCEFINDGIY